MKSLVRWSATLGLVGSALLGSFATENLSALALPPEQVVQKLQSVPVFTVTDEQGSPLIASVPAEGNQPKAVAGVFMSKRDAQAFVDRLKREKPEIGNKVQVVPVSLGEVYRLDRENQNKPDGLDFAFIPAEQQVQEAQALRGQGGQGGQQAQPFQGVPLFVARAGQDQGYLTVQRNGQSVIPLFFEKAQLQQMIDRFKQQQPNLASTIKMEAVPLEGVIATLQNSNDAQIGNIVLVPSQEAIEFLRSLPASQQNAPQAPQQQNAPQVPQQQRAPQAPRR